MTCTLSSGTKVIISVLATKRSKAFIPWRSKECKDKTFETIYDSWIYFNRTKTIYHGLLQNCTSDFVHLEREVVRLNRKQRQYFARLCFGVSWILLKSLLKVTIKIPRVIVQLITRSYWLVIVLRCGPESLNRWEQMGKSYILTVVLDDADRYIIQFLFSITILLGIVTYSGKSTYIKTRLNYFIC